MKRILKLLARMFSKSYTVKRHRDESIEWYGGDVCLKRKNYPIQDIQHNDDFRYEVLK